LVVGCTGSEVCTRTGRWSQIGLLASKRSLGGHGQHRKGQGHDGPKPERHPTGLAHLHRGGRLCEPRRCRPAPPAPPPAPRPRWARPPRRAGVSSRSRGVPLPSPTTTVGAQGLEPRSIKSSRVGSVSRAFSLLTDPGAGRPGPHRACEPRRRPGVQSFGPQYLLSPRPAQACSPTGFEPVWVCPEAFG